MSPAGASNRAILVATTVLLGVAVLAGTSTSVPVTERGSDPASTAPDATISDPVDTAVEAVPGQFTILPAEFSVAPDRQLPPVSATYPFDGNLPSRPAAVSANSFIYGDQTAGSTGGSEQAGELADLNLGMGPKVTCPAHLTVRHSFAADSIYASSCSVVRSPAGEFVAIARNASLNSFDSHQISAVVVEIFTVRRMPDGSLQGTEVMSAWFTSSLCENRHVAVEKLRVGNSEVLVVRDDNGLRTSNTTVIAANEEGFPEVVASYIARGASDTGWEFLIGATDRSMILASPRTNPDFEESTTVREIFPSSKGWRERIRVADRSMDDLPLSFGIGVATHLQFDFQFPMFDWEQSEEWCSKNVGN